MYKNPLALIRKLLDSANALALYKSHFAKLKPDVGEVDAEILGKLFLHFPIGRNDFKIEKNKIIVNLKHFSQLQIQQFKIALEEIEPKRDENGIWISGTWRKFTLTINPEETAGSIPTLEYNDGYTLNQADPLIFILEDSTSESFGPLEFYAFLCLAILFKQYQQINKFSPPLNQAEDPWLKLWENSHFTFGRNFEILPTPLNEVPIPTKSSTEQQQLIPYSRCFWKEHSFPQWNLSGILQATDYPEYIMPKIKM